MFEELQEQVEHPPDLASVVACPTVVAEGWSCPDFADSYVGAFAACLAYPASGSAGHKEVLADCYRYELQKPEILAIKCREAAEDSG